MTWLRPPDFKPREKLGATIDHVAVQHAVSYSEYLDQMGEASADRSRSASPLPGDMVFVHVDLLGFKDRSYGVSIKLLDDRDVRLSPRPDTPVGKTVSTCEGLSPAAALTLPPRAGRFSPAGACPVRVD